MIWENYDRRFNALIEVERGRTIAELNKFFRGNFQGKNILDIGCGTGRNTILLARKGAKVVGVDIDEDMIKIARGKTREANLEITYRIADVTQRLRHRNNYFDAIVANLVMAHIEDIEPVLKDINRILKPGGIFISTDEHPKTPHRKGMGDRYKVSDDFDTWSYRHHIKHFNNALKKAGFKVKAIRDWKSTKKIQEIAESDKDFDEKAKRAGWTKPYFPPGYLLGIMYVAIKQ